MSQERMVILSFNMNSYTSIAISLKVNIKSLKEHAPWIIAHHTAKKSEKKSMMILLKQGQAFSTFILPVITIQSLAYNNHWKAREKKEWDKVVDTIWYHNKVIWIVAIAKEYIIFSMNLVCFNTSMSNQFTFRSVVTKFLKNITWQKTKVIGFINNSWNRI